MKQKILLIAILLLGSILRLYKISSIPPGINWDEAAVGFNAYLINQTGRDEWGQKYPLSFRSFDDYKAPAQTYLIALSEKLFGVNEFAVRFPSALAGTISILLIYLLTKKFFELGDLSGECPNGLSRSERRPKLALLASFLLGISPWHFMLSRAAFEANLATCFFVIAVYLLFCFWNNKKIIPAIFSAFFFALTLYTFNSFKIVTPLFLLAFVILLVSLWLKPRLPRWVRQLPQLGLIKPGIIFSILLILFLSPLIPYFFNRESRLRFDEVNIFKNLAPIEISNQRRAYQDNDFIARLINHRYLLHGSALIKNFFIHFNPSYLFIRGDGNPRFSTQTTGQFYLFEFIPLLIGAYYLIKKHPRLSIFFFAWLLISLLPAALAREVPHALRSLGMLPIPQIILAFGIFYLARQSWFKKILIVLFYSYFFAFFLHFYYHHYSRIYAHEWQMGHQQLVNKLNQLESDYDQIFITSGYGRPYIFIAFYSQYPPDQFQQNVVRDRDWFGFWTVNSFDKYHFETPSSIPPNTLMVSSNPPGEAQIIDQIEAYNKTYFYLWEP